MNLISVPEILIPNNKVDLYKWAVIACDQFTSNREYWSTLKNICGDISALKLIFPEVYLNDANRLQRIDEINATMNKYLEEGIFECVNGFILTVRRTKYGNERAGLLLCFDLEQYSVDEKLAVRATEATVKERIPVRVEIRKNAPLELPHAIVLIDDVNCGLIEVLYKNKEKLKKLYETELNMQGGRLEGYLVEDTSFVIDYLDGLCSESVMKSKYGTSEPFLFAVGDGNHSIAAAKACWDNLKKTLPKEQLKNHPARYFLAEVNNIYDKSVNFEPIYRALFNADERFIEKMQRTLSGDGSAQLVYRGNRYSVNVPENTAEAIRVIQNFIDEYIKDNPEVSQDYIHGLDNLLSVCNEKNCPGVIMPKLYKSHLFKYISEYGPLTRKSFSIGETEEKRYYFEARKITE